ncbi:MAG: hypothetical protein CVU03_04625 [Bacteroidetes bacterium HGW-Bacteroidetes-2]|nr:MAG: hypothetical protein CVU03_04625 [Bacteroidetes bacterium HGW-Bacteroidetes-2]
MQFIVHYGMHFMVPFAIAFLFFKTNNSKVYAIFLLAMLIDIDHLFATPIFEAGRCSIGFHPLHSYIAISGYGILLFFKKSRIIGLALLWHILTDAVDCLW